MSHTDRVLDAICNKMDRLIENQKQIERRPRFAGTRMRSARKEPKKLTVSVRKPEKE